MQQRSNKSPIGRKRRKLMLAALAGAGSCLVSASSSFALAEADASARTNSAKDTGSGNARSSEVPGDEVLLSDTFLLRDLYNKDLSFSERALAADGKRISIIGYMAPPLKAESRFFVLTRRPMSVCPFCESDADWPDDIIAVYTKRTVKVLPFNAKMTVKGVLQLGGFKDTENGFYSKVRVIEATYRRGA